MGTRSDIILKEPNSGDFVSVYCHWDGYPSHNGKILFQNYNTIEKVRELISLGSISELKKTVRDTVDYHRMRKDPIEMGISQNLYDHTSQVYSYLFIEGEWLLYKDGRKWMHLGLVLKEPDTPQISFVTLTLEGSVVAP